MNDENPLAEKASDGSTDDEQLDCSECSPGLSCYRHFGSDGGPAAHTDGGETDEITLGERFYLEGEPCTVEVATFAHNGCAAVLETFDADELREYIVPVTLIEESDVVTPV